jgi:DNA-binding NarL/FixJ family response regulator
MPKEISLSIAEDHPFFSKGVANALGLSKKYAIAGCIEKADDILPHLREHEPSILLLDINMSGQNTLSLLPAIKKQHPTLKIIILSMYQPGEVDYGASAKYIDAYVLKNSGAEILQHALTAVGENQKYMDPNTASTPGDNADRFSNKLKLSSREKEILALLKEGLPNKAIGERLFISELTVKTHRKNIMHKMECRNLAELIRKT